MSLIYRVPANEPRMDRGKTIIPPPLQSCHVLFQLIIMRTQYGRCHYLHCLEMLERLRNLFKDV